jgi:hypothetical protein
MLGLDPRYGNNFLDCNALDCTDPVEDAAMDEILKLHEDPENFTLLLPHSVKAEIEHPGTPAEKKRLAQNFIFSMPVELTAPELALHDKVSDSDPGKREPRQARQGCFPSSRERQVWPPFHHEGFAAPEESSRDLAPAPSPGAQT